MGESTGGEKEKKKKNVSPDTNEKRGMKRVI